MALPGKQWYGVIALVDNKAQKNRSGIRCGLVSG